MPAMVTATTHDHAGHDHPARSWRSRIMAIITTMITIMTSIAVTSITTAIPMLMTTNKPPTAAAQPTAAATSRAAPRSRPVANGADESEAAALYRLMTWLSPSFPVGAFSYSSGIEWAVEAGDITDAASLRRMAGVDAGGRAGILRRRLSGARASGRCVARRCERCAKSLSLRRPSCPRASASSRPRRRAARLSRLRARHGIATALDRMIAACEGAIVYPVAVGVVSAAHAHSARADAARLPPRAGLELDIRRRAAGPARPDR